MTIHAGVVTWYDTKKCFGRLTSETIGRRKLFFHRRDVLGGDGLPIEKGQRASFEVTETPKGIEARRVRLYRSEKP